MQIRFTVREQNYPEPDTLYLDVRPGVRELRKNNRRLKLSLRQYKFVQALMANHPTPMTHWELFYHIWGEGFGGQQHAGEDGGPLSPNSCIVQYAHTLRLKLAPLGLTIEAPRKGYGYQLLEGVA